MRFHAPLLAVLLVAACTRDAPSGQTASSPTAVASPAVRRAALLADADRRLLTDALRDAVQSPDVVTRREGMLALARMHLPEAVTLLRAGLRDSDAEVRIHASQGLADLSDAVTLDLGPTVLGAAVAEEDPAARVALLRDLGRVGAAASLPALVQALASDASAERGAACAALGGFGLRQRAVPEDVLRRVATRAVDDPSAQVRLLCAFALARLPPAASPDARRALVAELQRAASDSGAEVRSQALRALQKYPEAPSAIFEALAADPDPWVRVQAFHGLAAQAASTHDRALATALEAQLERVLALDSIEGAEAVVLLDAMQDARPLARNGATYAVATAALERLGALPEARRGRAAALLHCGAAALVDHGRGWPSRLEHCGFDAVSPGFRNAEMAGVLAAGRGSEGARAQYLGRLARDPDERVREAVVAAAAAVADPGATGLLLAGLSDTDFGVVTATCDALLSLAPAWAADAAVVPVPPRPDAATLAAAMQTAYVRLTGAHAVEGLHAWLAVVDALPMPFPADAVRDLALHANPEVRGRARSILASRGVEPPTDPVLPVPDPIDPSILTDLPSSPIVRIRTESGDIVVRLEAVHSPVTTARILGLVDAGFYDGLTFHRVIPGFVAQGGDPRGDGYGGPGWTLRDELGRLPFVRGTVGIALAGRDTGGSQFFVTTADHPQLDGRYTVLGRVVEGMEVVDSLLPGDTMLEVRRASPP